MIDDVTNKQSDRRETMTGNVEKEEDMYMVKATGLRRKLDERWRECSFLDWCDYLDVCCSWHPYSINQNKDGNKLHAR